MLKLGVWSLLDYSKSERFLCLTIEPMKLYSRTLKRHLESTWITRSENISSVTNTMFSVAPWNRPYRLQLATEDDIGPENFEFPLGLKLIFPKNRVCVG